MTDRMVGLTACSKSKRGEDEPDREFAARDLYDSWLFDGRTKALETHCDEWAIFSAEHGYVEPADQLTYYDKRITELDPEERRTLAEDIVEALPEADRLMILMGRDYAEPLKAALPDGVEVWDPLEGVCLFDQRSELKDLASQSEQARLLTDGGRDTAGDQQVPLCHKFGCPDLADVAVIRTASIKERPRAYCEDHIPTESPNTDWLGIRRWPAAEAFAVETVYAYRSGDILHLEHPDGSEAICGHFETGPKRYCLSIGVPDGCRLCGACCDAKAWAESVDEDVARRWIRGVREIATQFETVKRQAGSPKYRYPTPDAREMHQIAEGI